MGEGELIELVPDRFGHLRIAMTEAGDRRPAGPVEPAPPLGIEKVAAFPTHRDRRHHGCLSREDVRHCEVSSRPDRVEWPKLSCLVGRVKFRAGRPTAREPHVP